MSQHFGFSRGMGGGAHFGTVEWDSGRLVILFWKSRKQFLCVHECMRNHNSFNLVHMPLAMRETCGFTVCMHIPHFFRLDTITVH